MIALTCRGSQCLAGTSNSSCLKKWVWLALALCVGKRLPNAPLKICHSSAVEHVLTLPRKNKTCVLLSVFFTFI